MTPKKIERAFELANCFKGTATKQHILKNMSADSDILSTLTAKQLAAVINVANRSYHDGKSSCGASIEDDCVWIGKSVQKLIPLKALEALVITESVELEKRATLNSFFGDYVRWAVTTYTVDYKERI